jgi:membrane-bound lytic murein transglycosylase D
VAAPTIAALTPAHARRKLRIRFVLPLALVALLAACATPVPQTPPSAPEPVVPAPAPEPSVEPPPPAPEIPADVSVPSPFTPQAAEALEALPPAADDLWVRIRKGFALQDIDGPLVEKWEQWYVERPDYVARMIERSRRYLYYIVVEVEARGMPSEIALLPMVESAYNPNALSTSRASGIWQFIPSTGSLYGMKQNFWFDSRRDVIAATDGALTYLQKLYGDFGDWQLALAAYNWGEGNVAKAIAFNEKRHKPTDYLDLKMPVETRNYLPKLQAVKNIISDPEKYGVALADIPDAPYFALVKTSREMDVKRAAELAEMSVDEFRYLNPHHNRPVIAGADEYTILLPIDKAELFAAKLDLIDQPLVSWQAYRLRKGETLAEVATRFGLSVETLRAINGLGARARVPTGHTLLVPAAHPTQDTEDGLAQAVFTTVPQGRTFYYRVHRGDTLSRIAVRYDVSVQDLRRWNGIAGSSVVPGQRLRITSELAPNAGKAKRAGGRKSVSTQAKPAKATAAKNARSARSAALPGD